MNGILTQFKAASDSRRMRQELQGRRHRIGLRSFERLMGERGIEARHKRSFKARMDF